MTIKFLTKRNKNLAYSAKAGSGLTLVFLGGFMSDMMGSKATHLEEWAEKNHYGFLRFDYSGHGQSSGTFQNCTISDWVTFGVTGCSDVVFSSGSTYSMW